MPLSPTGVIQKLATRNGVFAGRQRRGPLGFAEKLGVSVLERGQSPDTSKEGSLAAPLCSNITWSQGEEAQIGEVPGRRHLSWGQVLI